MIIRILYAKPPIQNSLRAYAIDCLFTCFLFCFIGFYNGLGRTGFVMAQGIGAAFLSVFPGGMPSGVAVASMKAESVNSGERTQQLKSYLRRLGAGEELESVRADFAQAFSDVEASEIMQAEQELMQEGTPLTEVQKLCDLHSALFHGATREEKIANAEKAVEESLRRSASASTADYSDKHERAAALAAIPGHPLHTLTRENEALTERITAAREAFAAGADMTEPLANVREVIIHYEKKGDLLYPLLDVRYGISGPSDVMWTVDDEIRDELAALRMIPCTACHYCVYDNDCPKKIKIPELFSCYNLKTTFHDWNQDYYYNQILTHDGGRASSCIRCGKCEKVCPQHLEIRKLLQDVAKEFER